HSRKFSVAPAWPVGNGAHPQRFRPELRSLGQLWRVRWLRHWPEPRRKMSWPQGTQRRASLTGSLQIGSSLLGINFPPEPEIESIEAIILPDEIPATTQLVSRRGV